MRRLPWRSIAARCHANSQANHHASHPLCGRRRRSRSASRPVEGRQPFQTAGHLTRHLTRCCSMLVAQTSPSQSSAPMMPRRRKVEMRMRNRRPGQRPAGSPYRRVQQSCPTEGRPKGSSCLHWRMSACLPRPYVAPRARIYPSPLSTLKTLHKTPSRLRRALRAPHFPTRRPSRRRLRAVPDPPTLRCWLSVVVDCRAPLKMWVRMRDVPSRHDFRHEREPRICQRCPHHLLRESCPRAQHQMEMPSSLQRDLPTPHLPWHTQLVLGASQHNNKNDNKPKQRSRRRKEEGLLRVGWRLVSTLG